MAFLLTRSSRSMAWQKGLSDSGYTAILVISTHTPLTECDSTMAKAGGGIRTPDHLGTKQMIFRLSYASCLFVLLIIWEFLSNFFYLAAPAESEPTKPLNIQSLNRPYSASSWSQASLHSRHSSLPFPQFCFA